MAIRITIENKDVGNSRRGYHNTDATITFEYDGGAYASSREEEIIRELTLANQQMWWRIKEYKTVTDGNNATRRSVYLVNYGYDSGD